MTHIYERLTDKELRSVMDDARKEFARRVRIAIGKGTLPTPELVTDAHGNTKLFKSIEAYKQAHPELDMLTCTEAVKAEAGIQ